LKENGGKKRKKLSGTLWRKGDGTIPSRINLLEGLRGAGHIQKINLAESSIAPLRGGRLAKPKSGPRGGEVKERRPTRYP